MARHQLRADSGYEEMGFPSRLFLNEFPGRFNSSLLRTHRDPYASDVVDTLSDQFHSLSLLRPKLRPTPPTLLQPSRPQSFSSAYNLSNGGPRADKRVYSAKPKLSPSDPFYELRLSRLTKNELQQERARVLQRQEARLQKEGLVHRNGNVLKESVGTGVFHPLQRPTSATVTSAKKRNQSNRNQSEKKYLTKGKRGVMTTKQQQQEECHYHLPSDMDFFSEDWNC